MNSLISKKCCNMWSYSKHGIGLYLNLAKLNYGASVSSGERFNKFSLLNSTVVSQNLKTLSVVLHFGNIENTCRTMAGHSKWANIRHTKAAKDAQKSKIFDKYGKIIRLAIKEGGSSDPKLNSRLAQVVEQAKSNSVPTATIQNVIKASQNCKEDYKQMVMDIKGPNGSVILADVVSTNLAHTRMLLNTVLRKNNFTVSDRGSRNLFESKGIILAVGPSPGGNIETVLEDAINAGAEDVKEVEEDDGIVYQFVCAPTEFTKVKLHLEALKYEVLPGSGIEFVPHSLVALSDSDLEKVQKLCDALEKAPEVVALYDNIA